ncbi:MAG: FIST signal transduction protein [Kofleriaceae bacterium]
MQSHALSFDLSSGTWNTSSLPAVDSPRTLVMAFGAPELIDQPGALEQLARAYPRSLVVGCSTSGEIHGAEIRDHSLSVSVTRFDRTDLQLAAVEVRTQADSYTAGLQIARKLTSKPGLRGVLVLSEGLHVNGSELIRGLNSVLDDSVVVTGGLSGDGANFKRTWVSVGNKVKTNLVAAVGFYGDHVSIGHGSKGGWDKFGPERIVTRSKGNVVYELDGRPALQLYKEYLGERAKDLPASGLFFPLSVRASADDEKFVVRTVLGVDHEANSLTFAGDIPEGYRAQLMKANFDSLIDGAGDAGAMTLQNGAAPADSDALVVAISCVGRRIVLGERTEEEVEAVRDAVRSKRACITGFYSYGEISPFAKGHSDLHNQTMTLTVFSESPTPLARPARGSMPVIDTSKPAISPAAQAAVLRGKTSPTMPFVNSRTQPGVAKPATQPAGFAVRDVLFDVHRGAWDQPLPELDSPRTMVLAFGAPEIADDPSAFHELARAYPRSLVVGCSSAGEIYGATVRDHSLAVTVTRFERTELQLAALEVSSKGDSYGTGYQLAKKLAAKPGLRGVLVLSEGLQVNGSELIRGLNAVLDDSVVVTGGLSGDGAAFKRTWVAVGDKVKTNMVAAVGFYGDYITIGHGSKGGWDKFGPERIVTRSEGNIVYELDGRPALQLYKEYLGERAKDLPASGLYFPLSVRASGDDEKFVVRTVLGVDHATNSLTFAGDIPEGYRAQLMKANFDNLIDGAGAAGSMTAETGAVPANADALVVAISCVGRRVVLGERTEEEVEAVRDAVRCDRAKITGFYSYGEISPFATGHCDLHNQTMTLTVFSESPTPIRRAPSPRVTRPSSPPTMRNGTPNSTIKVPDRTSSVSLQRAPERPDQTDSIPGIPMIPVHAVAAPSGPLLRLPRQLANNATIETSAQGGFQVVKIRGRLTESFKGEQLGRTLSGRVVFDLGEVDRVTSFGVREWLAMMTAASAITESYFIRCSESVVNQLTMIRRFDGGARIASFFAPYLCTGCGGQVERLLDCERDAAELRSLAPAPVHCPRCDGEARFDDDARSYFAFAAAHVGTVLPHDLRALHDLLASHVAPAAMEEIEKTVGDVTRIRVSGKLSSQLRWRKVLDGIEGGLVIDLTPIAGSDAAGINNLEQALRALPPEVAPVQIEGAPSTVIDRMLQAGTPRIEVVSAVVTAYCGSCAVHRPTMVRIDQYAHDVAKGLPHHLACKRCNGELAITATDSLDALVRMRASAAASMSMPAHYAAPHAPASTTPALAQPIGRPETSWKLMLLVGALTGAVAALGLAVYTSRRAPAASDPATVPTIAMHAEPAMAAATAPPTGASDEVTDRAGWHDTVDLPPAWVERPFAIEGDTVFVVGHGAPAVTAQAALDSARAAATMTLVEQLYADLPGSSAYSFLEKRIRRGVPGAAQAVAARFDQQNGKHVAFERVDLATRSAGTGFETYARYSLPKAQYDELRTRYGSIVRFRGVRVAAFFPLLETSLRAGGDLIVAGVDPWVASDPSAMRESDVILKVAGTPVSTLDGFRSIANAQWSAIEPKMRLSFEVETAGARRTVVMTKPVRRTP